MSTPSLLAVVNRFTTPSETFVLRKLTGLRDEGFDVAVAASSFDPAARETGLRLVPREPWHTPGPLLSGDGPALATAMVRAAAGSRSARASKARRRLLLAPLLATKPDIIHFEFSGLAVDHLDLLGALRPAQLVVSCRGTAEKLRALLDPERAAALGEVFRTVDLVHCVSEDMAEAVTALGAPAEKLFVNRPAVPVADFSGLADLRSAHDGPLRVLSVGRLHWLKGTDDGLRAVRRAVDAGQPVEYRIVGDGDDRDKLAFLIHQLGIEASVSLLGTATQAEVREQLLWADVVLLPSLSEGISNVALEAMASGLPVISTNCGGMAEVINDGVDGLVVPVGDTEAMAAALAQLGSDPELRARLARAAHRRAAAEFGADRQIASFVARYRELLEDAHVASI